MEQLNRIIADNLYLVAGVLVIWFIVTNKKSNKTQQAPTAPPPSAGGFPVSSVDDEAFIPAGNPQPDLLSKAKLFIEHWPEVWMIPILIAIAAAINYGLMAFWPDAIFLGPEFIQKLLFKTIGAFLAYFLFFVRDRLDFKESWQWYISSDRQSEYNELTPWQKRVTFFWRLSVFVLAFALIS